MQTARPAGAIIDGPTKGRQPEETATRDLSGSTATRDLTDPQIGKGRHNVIVASAVILSAAKDPNVGTRQKRKIKLQRR